MCGMLGMGLLSARSGRSCDRPNADIGSPLWRICQKQSIGKIREVLPDLPVIFSSDYELTNGKKSLCHQALARTGFARLGRKPQIWPAMTKGL
jgi:hypothetical protein